MEAAVTAQELTDLRTRYTKPRRTERSSALQRLNALLSEDGVRKFAQAAAATADRRPEEGLRGDPQALFLSVFCLLTALPLFLPLRHAVVILQNSALHRQMFFVCIHEFISLN